MLNPARMRWIPAVVIGGPFVASFLAWLGPVHGGRLGGYDIRTVPTAAGTALLVLWVGILVLVGTLGFDAGLRAGGFRSLRAVTVREVHLLSLAAGVTGTVWAYAVATGGNPGLIVDLWRQQQFNALRYGLEYGVGVHTLRYGAIIAGGLSIGHLVLTRRPRGIDVASLLTLVAAAFLASRLSIVMALFAAAAVILGSADRRRIRAWTLIAGVGVLSVLFIALNFSRNGATYREGGISNPVVMAAVNGQGYLATPTQVSLAVTAGIMDDRVEVAERAGGALGAVLPSYVINQFGLELGLQSASNRARYQDAVSVDEGFTTNGSLPALLLDYGWASLPGALAVIALAALLAARLAMSGTVGLPFAGVLLYGLAEMWRLFLLNQGIYQFLLLMAVGLVLLGWVRLLGRREGVRVGEA